MGKQTRVPEAKDSSNLKENDIRGRLEKAFGTALFHRTWSRPVLQIQDCVCIDSPRNGRRDVYDVVLEFCHPRLASPLREGSRSSML